MGKQFQCCKELLEVPDAFLTDEHFKWRVRPAVWRSMLMQGCYTLVKDGLLRRFQAKQLLNGKMEVSLIPLSGEET